MSVFQRELIYAILFSLAILFPMGGCVDITSAKKPSLLSIFLCKGSLIKRWAVPLWAVITGDDARLIFSRALARLSGFLVNSADDVSARYSLCLDTIIAIIRESSGARSMSRTMRRRIKGFWPLLFESFLGLMPPNLQTLKA